MYEDIELLKKEKESLLAMRIEVKYQVDDGFYVVFVKVEDRAYSTEIYPKGTDIRSVLCKEMTKISTRLTKVNQAIQTIKDVYEGTGDFGAW